MNPDSALAIGRSFFMWFDPALLVYLLSLNLIYCILMISGWQLIYRYVSMRALRDYRYVGQSEMSMPVSILVPAYNEEPIIADSIRSLRNSQFSQLEIVVVNDGSKDGTLERLKEEFALVPIDVVPRSGLPTQPVTQVYLSSRDQRIVVVDKVNGGKADSLNTGLNYAQYPLVCAIDADTILDPGALSRLVWEFQSDPDTVATGGIVRVVNGSRVRAGQIERIQTPSTLLGNIQILEYLRAFLGGRIGWSRWNLLLVISGAFGLFRRDVLIEAGGYDVNTITEDAELIVRIRRLRADQGKPCRISFFPDPICWTEAPTSAKQLVSQRDRWQRGLGELLITHRAMLFNPKYGRIGLIAIPYYWLFELLEPVVTVVGLALVTVGLFLGMVNPVSYALMVGLATAFGLLLSLTVILLEERAYRRYPNWRDLSRLGVAAILENFGYRQWQALIRMRALWRIRGKAHHWGEMTRTGFSEASVTG
ncbi:MAG: glycosyltransferase [Candidatus Nanopelagicales bacterium]